MAEENAGQLDVGLLELADAYAAPFLLRAALRLGLAERIGERTVTAESLADEAGWHAPTVLRTLRALAALDVLAEGEPGRFRLTARGHRLRPNVPDSMYAFLAVSLDDPMWNAWPALDHSVRTGQSAFEHVHGSDYMTAVGWTDGSVTREQVDRLMIDETASVTPYVLAAVDLARFSTVVDIGGGSGPLIAAVLAVHSGMRGVLLDRADGAAHAPDVLARAGVENRCEIRIGDFLDSVPPADLYVCKSVLFNYAADAAVARLLANVREAIAADGRLLLVEQMLPTTVDGSVPARLYLDDINSVVSLGGRWRTEPEYRSLLTAAGFSMVVHPLPLLGYSVIEAAPAG
ncbi:methyltransferase [Pseudonocardia phyllosphaerae]|uniref:methyltransferase n=1 Tax=Pseudonocardia phyllosphaerae TaxID=3390502 RepID=UPI0039780C19